MTLHGIPHGSADWWKARENCMGASEIGAVLGVDDYTSPLKLFMKKRMEKQRPKEDHRTWGLDVEGAVLTHYARRNGYELLPSPGWLRHPAFPVGATADGLGVKGGMVRDIQAKNVEEHHVRDWGEPETAQVPVGYFAQVTVEVGVLLAQPQESEVETIGDIAVSFGGRPPLGFHIPFDAELFGNLCDAAAKYVRDYLIPDKAPPLTGDRAALEYVKKRYVKSTGELLEPTSDVLKLVEQLRVAKQQGAAANETADQLQAQLCALIGDAYGFEGLCTWGVVKEQRRTVVDWPLVAEELNLKAGLSRDELKALVTKFTRSELVKESYRRLWLAKEKTK